MTPPAGDHRSEAVRVVPVTHHRTTAVNGVNIFYRQAGPADAPVVLLLHGFPTSSHMFRNLIPALADCLFAQEASAPAALSGSPTSCGRRASPCAER
jgi:hypothetical protein